VVDWQGSEVGFFWWRAWRGGRVSERVHVKWDGSGRRRVCGCVEAGCRCGSAARVKMRELRRHDSGGSGSAKSLVGALATLRGRWSGEYAAAAVLQTRTWRRAVTCVQRVRAEDGCCALPSYSPLIP
jgi:hypothetical protein